MTLKVYGKAAFTTLAVSIHSKSDRPCEHLFTNPLASVGITEVALCSFTPSLTTHIFEWQIVDSWIA